MNTEKLQKLQASVRTGGKGTPRRKVVKKPSNKSGSGAGGAVDAKLQTAMKKLNTQPIPMIEEVNMFKQDGRVIHVEQPKVMASLGSNMFAISGHSEDKDMAELLPGILSQMGPESLASLRKMAESYQQAMKNSGDAPQADDDIPELVENFEEVN